MRPFRFGVTLGRPRPAREWLDRARRVEDLGFDVLTVGDHLDNVLPPFPALTAAAGVTERLRLGTLVCNNDLRNPLVLANDAAALDLLSDGRLELGLGAGHAFPEYERAGIPFDPAAVRVARLAEAVAVVQPLLRGEDVTHSGHHYDVHEARLYAGPVQQPVPLLIGGWGRQLLALAAHEADIVGLSGAGRTLADGSRHAPTGFTPAAVDERVAFVREQAAGRDIELHALVQAVIVGDRAAGAAEVVSHIDGLRADDALGCPFILTGTVDEIVEELHAHRERWGISYFTVFEPFLDAFAPVVAALCR